MSRPRTFDWDEARRLRAEGLAYRAIAARVGASYGAVRLACDDEARENRKRYDRPTHLCRCGVLCRKNYKNGVLLPARCKDCRDEDQATSVRPDTLRCWRCRKWKTDENFSRSASGQSPRRRGRTAICKPCAVIKTRERRARQKQRTPLV